MDSSNVCDLKKLMLELESERKKCKEKDALLKKAEDELHVTKMHVNLLKKKPQEEVDATKFELTQMTILRDRLEHQLRNTQRELWQLKTKMAEMIPGSCKEECKEKDALLKKAEEELHVTKMHMKMLKKKPQEELNATKLKLTQMTILYKRVEHELRNTQRQLIKFKSSNAEDVMKNFE
jgi:hypothetical protein